MNLHQEQLDWGFPATDGLFAKYCNIQARKFATIWEPKSTCKAISLDLCTKWIVANLFTYFPFSQSPNFQSWALQERQLICWQLSIMSAPAIK